MKLHEVPWGAHLPAVSGKYAYVEDFSLTMWANDDGTYDIRHGGGGLFQWVRLPPIAAQAVLYHLTSEVTEDEA
jgi:DNA-binding transcriptional MocR family regulator